MSIDIANETSTVLDEVALVALARHVLAELHIHPQAELSILLVDVAAMTELHVRWMDEEGPTDVLSFPMDELRPGSRDTQPEPGLLGDVVLCPDVAQQQAGTAGHTLQAELEVLTTHGILHLLGYDHAEPDEEREMFEMQARLIAGWRREHRLR